MSVGKCSSPAYLWVIVMVALALSLQPGQRACAGQTGTFEGSLTASGSRQMLDFPEDRPAFTFELQGHVNLTDAVGETADFWARWIGLWDRQTGGVIRCVWDDMHGNKIYVVLSGTRMQEGATLTGQFVGGTGPFEGIEGSFIFTWTTVSFETGDHVVAGYARDIKGTYHIP